MSFPTTGLLDSFDRADENPLSDGGNWSRGPEYFGSLDDWQVVSNEAVDEGGTANGYRNNANYGPDCEVWAELGEQSVGAAALYLHLRCVNIGDGTTDGYACYFNAGSDFARIYRLTNAGHGTGLTQLGSNITAADLAAGSLVGFEARGDTLTAYHKPSGGSWTALGSRTDSTYSAAGRIGVRAGFGDSTARQFGGGTALTSNDKAGYAIAGLAGAGASAQVATETGVGVTSGVGRGARQSVLGVTYTKLGYGVAGTVARGAKEWSGTTGKSGFGKVGASASGESAPGAFNWEGVSIGLGQTMFDKFVTWTRVDT